MTNYSTSDNDSEFEDFLVDLLRQHYLALFKAPLIGLMVLFSVYVITDSVAKSLAASFVCCLVSFFGTWRRYLEPLSFAMFCLAVVIMCDHSLAEHLKSIGGDTVTDQNSR